LIFLFFFFVVFFFYSFLFSSSLFSVFLFFFPPPSPPCPAFPTSFLPTQFVCPVPFFFLSWWSAPAFFPCPFPSHSGPFSFVLLVTRLLGAVVYLLFCWFAAFPPPLAYVPTQHPPFEESEKPRQQLSTPIMAWACSERRAADHARRICNWEAFGRYGFASQHSGRSCRGPFARSQRGFAETGRGLFRLSLSRHRGHALRRAQIRRSYR